LLANSDRAKEAIGGAPPRKNAPRRKRSGQSPKGER
jgi:hypothetical protein